MCLQAVKWASEKQQACAKSCNILTLLNTLVSRKSHVVWSLGHFKHMGKNAQRKRIPKVLGWKRDHAETWSGGLRCISLETKGKYPGAKGLRRDNSWLKVPLFLYCSKPIKTSPATTSALDWYGFISLNGLVDRVGGNFRYSFCIHRIFDEDKQV